MWLSSLWPLAMWLAVVLAVSTTAAVAVERAVFGLREARRRRFEAYWVPLVTRAIAGDAAAERGLVTSPVGDRLALAVLLITPLVDDRDPKRIARTREIVQAMSLSAYAEGLYDSVWWWRRALAVRAAGLLQARHRTAQVIAALDDPHDGVRAAALDALADLRDPASLPAIVVRLLDTTLHRGRRVAALKAFEADAEPLLLDHAEIDPAHRANFARALVICGTSRSRAALCRWTADPRADVRASAFQALARIGVDAPAAQLAIAALEDGDAPVRAAAARALRGWSGPGDATAHLARHLDDAWIVAAGAARSLQSIVPGGLDVLRLSAARADLTGLLSRQMLWEVRTE
jgi:hypothetical protein